MPVLSCQHPFALRHPRRPSVAPGILPKAVVISLLTSAAPRLFRPSLTVKKTDPTASTLTVLPRQTGELRKRLRHLFDFTPIYCSADEHA